MRVLHCLRRRSWRPILMSPDSHPPAPLWPVGTRSPCLPFGQTLSQLLSEQGIDVAGEPLKVALQDFSGDKGSTCTLYPAAGSSHRRVMLAGVGKVGQSPSSGQGRVLEQLPI